MSAFGEYHKDNIMESVMDYISFRKEQSNNIQLNEILRDIMEAVGEGLHRGVWEIENQDNASNS